MQIEKIEIGRLKAAPYNPRKKLKPGDAEYEKLKRSIEEFGFVEPVIWNKRTGNVVGGHQRVSVLKDLGYTEIDTVVVDIDTQKEKALNIALNKISGEWDETLLTDLLKDLEQSGFDLELTGFDMAEVKDLYGSGSIENAHEDNFDEDKAAAEAESNTIAKNGDLWLLGKHRLLCGDCTRPEEIAVLMAGAKADLMVTDPPYNVNYKDKVEFRNNGIHNVGRAVSDIANDDMSDKDFYEFLLNFYKTAYAVMKGGAALYVFHSTKESVNFITAMKAAGFKVAQTLVWIKNHFTFGRQDYQWIHEPILYGWKEAEKCPHYFIDDRTLATIFEEGNKDFKKLSKDEMRGLLERIFSAVQTDIIKHDKPTRNADHPTMKPITLCAKLIFNSSREGELVFEPFAGSGSTLIAAAQLNRICYASEIDDRYATVIIKRFHENFPEEEIRLFRNKKEVVFDVSTL
jgi:DNA modification methylase